ncbi:MAG: response regulator [Sulfurimonas sp.]|uniref:response regulator n=1 Tax=Sulfurimonas sp. TaxID=2022749 RepID=UPI00261D0F3A|nr:response regulator [Sulfurimonas sp.]MCW8894901.1 response regulator [Sulfurimonas sp.]MCW8954634.1 response regulator [Sulfurimonas sp.]MCW9068181.1 response regulator [Sulfurimonas sp.]
MEAIINENLIEVLAGVTAVTLLVLYIFLKISQKKVDVKTKKEEIKPEEAKVETPSKPEQSPEVEISTATKKVEKSASTEINRKKREPVYHDKIVKDDFKIFEGVKILVAEDNIINQKVITALLADSGIEVTIANDGQEALNILENDNDYAVILMDAHMPNIDGFQATRLIRENKNYDHIPVVALSGDTAADDIKNMMNVGMEAHLEKPLKMDALYDVLYTYTTGNESKDTSAQNDEILEFNIEKGLDICGGDKEFYLEILNDFMSKYTDSSEKIQKYLNNSDSTSADKILLDILGVAANIGADALHDSALALKNSIAQPNDLEYINKLKTYKRSLSLVIEEIKAYKVL